MTKENPEFDPSSRPTLRLFNHILQKGFQAGSVLGIGAIGPAAALYTRSLDPLLLTKTLGYSGLAFTAVAGGLGIVKYVKMDQDGLQDRVYRLHYNEGQNRCDQFAGLGGVLGAAAANYLLKSRAGLQAINIVGGSAAGVALGVLLHVATLPEGLKAANNRMIDEAKAD